MKNFRNKIWTYALVVFLFASCEDYLDVNTDPNNPTEVPLHLLMSQASFTTGDNIQLAGNITSYYVQYLASPNAFGSKDIHDPQPYDVTWEEFYRTLSNIYDMQTLAEEQNAAHYRGAAKILKAINLGLVLDLWGDVPYTQAFTAEFLQPAYDDDEVLYTEVLTLLAQGIEDLSQTNQAVTLGDDDFIYGGNINGWIQMAHSLIARYRLHMSNTASFDANAVIAAADMGIQTSATNADITYFTAGTDTYNPWASVARNQESLILDGWISAQLADAMNGTTFGVVDPRMPFMFGDTEAGQFIGVENGAGRGANVDVSGDRSVLERGTYYASDDSPILVITSAETKFIKAEAAFLNNDKNTAYQSYLEGIAEHMAMLGVPAADSAAYVGNAAVSVGSANITLDLIMKEKYIAMFLHPEAWNDARRYDYQYADMTLPANHNPALSGQFIRRLIYPESEQSRNGNNVPVITALDRVWWDQ